MKVMKYVVTLKYTKKIPTSIRNKGGENDHTRVDEKDNSVIFFPMRFLPTNILCLNLWN